MTCEEYQKTIRTTSIFESTRALRGALNNHYHSCPSCQEWIETLPDMAEDDSAAQIIDTMVREDRRDPEY